MNQGLPTATRRLGARVAVLYALLLSSCTTYHQARFHPSPLEVKIEDERAPGVLARGLVAVRGIRRTSAQFPGPQFEVVLRIENVGRKPFEIDLESFELVSADLQALVPGRVSSDVSGPIAPGAVHQLEVVFPYPSGRRYGDLDISGLVVRWALRAADLRVVASASFQRARYHSDPYFYGGAYWVGAPYWRFHSGFVGPYCWY